MARDVPTGIVLGVRKNGAGARDVFFRSDGIDLAFRLVALFGNCQEADTVDRRVGGAKPGNGQTRMVPGEVDGVCDERQERECCGNAQDHAGAGRRANGRLRHGFELRGYSASGRVRVEARIGAIDPSRWVARRRNLRWQGTRTSRFVGEACKQRSWRQSRFVTMWRGSCTCTKRTSAAWGRSPKLLPGPSCTARIPPHHATAVPARQTSGTT